MDRHRFSRRAAELRAFAERMGPLAKMPDRATGADLQLAADLANKAADDLDELVKATPPGCICRRIENDNYSYFDYHEDCIHHRHYYHLSEKLKADYAKMEKALKDGPRMRVILATLTGAALSGMGSDEVEHQVKVESRVYSARALADEVVRRLTEIA